MRLDNLDTPEDCGGFDFTKFVTAITSNETLQTHLDVKKKLNTDERLQHKIYFIGQAGYSPNSIGIGAFSISDGELLF